MNKDNNGSTYTMAGFIAIIAIIAIALVILIIPVGISLWFTRRVSPHTKVKAFLLAAGIAGLSLFLWWIIQYSPIYHQNQGWIDTGFLAWLFIMPALIFCSKCMEGEPEKFLYLMFSPSKLDQIKRIISAKERRNQRRKNTGSGTFEGQQADDNFGFDPSAFGTAEPTAQNMPRGVDQRHPDDAIYWAVVDDPSAAPSERSKAFETILKRQAKREGKTARDLTRTDS